MDLKDPKLSDRFGAPAALPAAAPLLLPSDGIATAANGRGDNLEGVSAPPLPPPQGL